MGRSSPVFARRTERDSPTRASFCAPAPPQIKDGQNTTIGVVATNARLTKVQATKVAQMAQDGLARAIYPAHTMGDGDVVFALATGRDRERRRVAHRRARGRRDVGSHHPGGKAAESIPGYPAARDFP